MKQAANTKHKIKHSKGPFHKRGTWSQQREQNLTQTQNKISNIWKGPSHMRGTWSQQRGQIAAAWSRHLGKDLALRSPWDGEMLVRCWWDDGEKVSVDKRPFRRTVYYYNYKEKTSHSALPDILILQYSIERWWWDGETTNTKWKRLSLPTLPETGK